MFEFSSTKKQNPGSASVKKVQSKNIFPLLNKKSDAQILSKIIQTKDSLNGKSTKQLSGFINTSNLQPKLSIGKPNDPYEQEADQIADKVVGSPQTNSPGEIKRKEEEKKEPIRPKLQLKGDRNEVKELKIDLQNLSQNDLVTKAEDVRSIEIMHKIYHAMPKEIISRLEKQNELIDECMKDNKLNERERKLLNSLKMLTLKLVDSRDISFFKQDIINAATIIYLLNEPQSIKTNYIRIKQNFYNIQKGKINWKKVVDDCNKITKSIESLQTGKQIKESKKDFHQYDKEFESEEVKKILSLIKSDNAKFTVADIKAIACQETGDLTNYTVAGLKKENKSETTQKNNEKKIEQEKKERIKIYLTLANSPKGIGQIRKGALIDALVWGVKKGVAIKGFEKTEGKKGEIGGLYKDPRLNRMESIKLIALYIGKIVDYLKNGLPKPQPTGVEFKKLVFASYNKSHNKVIEAAKKYNKKDYSWDKIKYDINLKDAEKKEVINYVDEIIKRLLK